MDRSRRCCGPHNSHPPTPAPEKQRRRKRFLAVSHLVKRDSQPITTMASVLAMPLLSALYLSPRPLPSGRASVPVMSEPHAKVVFLRHGQSQWNEANLFTGWANVELTTLGKNEVRRSRTSNRGIICCAKA